MKFQAAILFCLTAVFAGHASAQNERLARMVTVTMTEKAAGHCGFKVNSVALREYAFAGDAGSITADEQSAVMMIMMADPSSVDCDHWRNLAVNEGWADKP